MSKSIEVPFWIDENGKRTLQCHSRGYKESINGRDVPLFSPFGVNLQYGNMKPTTLENLFMCSRVFQIQEEKVRPKDWRQAREYMKAHPQVGWDLGTGFIPVIEIPKKVDAWKVQEAGILFYITLYTDFLHTDEGQRRLAIAQRFDEFFDPFKGPFPFGQEEVFRTATRFGLDYLDTISDEIRDKMLPVRYLDQMPKNHVNNRGR